MDRRHWGALTGVRPEETGRFVYFFFLSVALSFGGTLGLVGSEALFLIQVGPSALPGAIVVASLSALVASLTYASLVGRVRNDRLLSALLVGGGGVIALILWQAFSGVAAGWTMLFCAFYVFQAVYINLHFWTFATDFFDTLASKRVFPLLAVGGSLGGLLGGAFGALLSVWFSAETLILAWAVTLVGLGILLFLTRARLMHWRVLDSVEADESSTEGMRGALDFMANSPLARWLALSVVGMVVGLTVMQYVYLDIFARSFRDSRELAGFFGLFLAVTNACEIAVGGLLTPGMVRRLGVARANLIHPITTVVAFVLLLVDPRLWVAMLARANREMIENSLAGPVRALFYNALPRRFRGRMRALLEGVFFFAAMSIAGLGLLLLQGTGMVFGVGVVGGVAAVVYMGANWRVRGEYLKSLVSEIERGRLDLTELAGSVGPDLARRLADAWGEFLADPDAQYGLAIGDLAHSLVAHGHSDRVQAQLNHPRSVVREACIEALVGARIGGLEGVLGEGLRDADVGIRRKSLDLLAEVGVEESPSLLDDLRACLSDADAIVKAHAASLLGDEGHPTLAEFMGDSRVAMRLIGLRYVPAAFEQAIRNNLDLGDEKLRASSLEALVRLELDGSLPLGPLMEDMVSSEVELRKVAADLLAGRKEPEAIEHLASGLGDSERSVRSRVGARLIGLGTVGFRAAEPLCRSSSLVTACAAVEVVGAGAGRRGVEATLSPIYEACVREAWCCRLALEQCQARNDLGFLPAALVDAENRNRKLAFCVLEQWEDARVVKSIARVLERQGGKSRSDALEVLSNLGLRPISAHFALLLENAPSASASAALRGFVAKPSDVRAVVEWARSSADPWLRMAVRGVGGLAESKAVALESGGFMNEEGDRVERLLALQQVSIFSGLSLEQLQRIDGLMDQEDFVEGEVVVAEGDHGENLYILLDGRVDFYKAWRSPGEIHLGQLSPLGYMGEIALLDNEPRSATAVAAEDCRFLTLSGIRFRELLLQAPEMGFEVFKALTARIRVAENRLDGKAPE
ncbi:MAG: Npt1/Npt2 family nucleotide transporter [Myxococcota bacterium]|nr:Npt1/Npt2 family nucleotide transporter [Myxococcota bacterium]